MHTAYATSPYHLDRGVIETTDTESDLHDDEFKIVDEPPQVRSGVLTITYKHPKNFRDPLRDGMTKTYARMFKGHKRSTLGCLAMILLKV